MATGRGVAAASANRKGSAVAPPLALCASSSTPFPTTHVVSAAGEVTLLSQISGVFFFSEEREEFTHVPDLQCVCVVLCSLSAETGNRNQYFLGKTDSSTFESLLIKPTRVF